MTLQISLTPEAATRLSERAAEAGVQPAEFASRIIESQVCRPTLEEISGPIHKQFLESGTTETELIEELERAKDESRAARRTRQAS